MIEVTVNAEDLYIGKASVTIQVNASLEIIDLMRHIGGNEIDKIIRGIAYLNPLGRYIYDEIRQYQEVHQTKYIDLFDKQGFWCNVPLELVNRMYMDEISRYITLQFTKALVYAMDIPEIDEKVATLNFPEFVVEQLKKYTSSADLKVEFYVKKKRGFNDLKITQVGPLDERIKDIMQYLAESTPYFMIQLDNLNLDNILIGYDTKVKIPYSEIYSKGADSVLMSIKRNIQQQLDNIEDKEYLNLVLASLYKGLSYSSSIEIFNRKELSSKYYIPEITIKRPYLFDDITVRFTLKTPLVKELCEKSEIIPIEIDTEEGTFHSNFMLSSPNQEYVGYITVPKEMKKTRMERIMNKDLSVIKDVEEIDKKIVEQIVSGIKEQIMNALVEHNVVIKNRRGNYKMNSEYTIDRFKRFSQYPCKMPPYITTKTTISDIEDCLEENEKQKVITYLVSEKIKNSIKGE